MTSSSLSTVPMIDSRGSPQILDRRVGKVLGHRDLQDAGLSFLQHREQVRTSTVDLVHDRGHRGAAGGQRHVDADSLEQPTIRRLADARDDPLDAELTPS